MKVFHAFLAVALMLGVSSLMAQEQPGQEPGKQQPATRDGDKQSDAQGAKADQEIAAVKLAECRAEVELAKVAQQKSQNEQVKQFAARMIKDHGEACTKLEKWAGDYAKVDKTTRPGGVAPGNSGANVDVQAGRSGVNVDVRGGKSSSLNWVAIHQQLAERCLASAKKELAQKEGAEFDHCYMGMQIMAHQKTVDADQVFASYVSAENRDKIEECMKTANDHLRSAKEIMEKLTPPTTARSASPEKTDR